MSKPTKNRGLGRGLSALMADVVVDESPKGRFVRTAPRGHDGSD